MALSQWKTLKEGRPKPLSSGATWFDRVEANNKFGQYNGHLYDFCLTKSWNSIRIIDETRYMVPHFFEWFRHGGVTKVNQN
jgi:hypothetical protein